MDDAEWSDDYAEGSAKLARKFLATREKGTAMYAWKCWHDTRFFFLTFVIIAAAAMPVAAAVSTGTHLIEQFGTMAFRTTFATLLVIVALALGAIGAIQEFAEKTTHFLFTKPRSRAYFVWVSWTIGCAELLAIGGMNFASGWLTLARYSSRPFHSYLFGSIGGEELAKAVIMGVFVYALTYALTAALRSGLKGLGASFLIMTGLNGIVIGVQIRWNVHLPMPSEQIAHLPIVASNAAWIAIALLFVLAAQMVIERAEI
jgi:hypothetical protein